MGKSGSMIMTARRGVRGAIGAAVAAGALVGGPPAFAQGTTGVLTFPSPNARSASPHSEITFRGARADALRGVVVSGSRSGRHAGTLRNHADGQGVSFVPSLRFAAGERVRVRVPASVRVRGGDGRISEFTVARIVGGFATEGPSGAARGHGIYAALKSRPELAPPTLRVNVAGPGRQPGYVFLAPKRGEGQGGPMIVDDAGHPRWFRPLGVGVRAADFRVQSYQGHPVLTWWQGRARGGSGRGVGMIVDGGYRTVKEVHAGNGLAADLHEFVLTNRGTALLLAYVPVRRSLAAVHGPRNGIAVDGVVQEVELATGRVRFEWHSLDHVPLSDTNLPRPTSAHDPYDYFHVNSVNADPDGGYVVSARRTSAVYKLDDTGNVQWVLGGRSGTLKRGPGVSFHLQHDAIGYGGGLYTIFDNSAKGVRRASRGITVRVDPAAATATLARTLRHPAHVLAATQGNLQMLGGGNAFVGWGSQGRASEFGPGGELLFDLELPRGFDTYRAYRFPWSGRPKARPRLAVTRGADGGATVYASWNGSTRTASWTVLAGPTPDRLAPVASAPWRGLETPIRVGRSSAYTAVEARDAGGAVLARSAVLRGTGRR